LRTTRACHTTGNRNPKKFTFAICCLRIAIYNNRRAYDIINAVSHFRPLRTMIYLYRVTVCFFAHKHISMYHFRKSCENLFIIVLFPRRNHCCERGTVNRSFSVNDDYILLFNLTYSWIAHLCRLPNSLWYKLDD